MTSAARLPGGYDADVVAEKVRECIGHGVVKKS